MRLAGPCGLKPGRLAPARSSSGSQEPPSALSPAAPVASVDTVAPPALGARRLADELAADGLVLRTGPFVYRLRSDVPVVAEQLQRLYAAYPRAPAAGFIDFEIELKRSRGWRRWIRPQSRFLFEGEQSFEPLPLAHGFALLEWAMNWCVSSQVNHYLLIHSAVLERAGRAVILPAPPGSGKSTLCAALVHRGWRLLSDEIAVVPLDTDGLRPLVWPLVRPVSLKNASIDVIAGFAPEARFSRPALGTAKGTVAHMQTPDAHVRRMDEPAPAAWIVFPRAGAPGPRPHSRPAAGPARWSTWPPTASTRPLWACRASSG